MPPIVSEEIPYDPNFTFLGTLALSYHARQTAGADYLQIWVCDRCASLIAQEGKRSHLEWHLKVH